MVLDFTYVKFVYKYYAYMGFKLDFSMLKFIFSFIYFIIIYFVLPKDEKKPSYIFLQLHFIIMIMPMFTLYAFANEAGRFMFYVNILFIMECILVRLLPIIKITRIKNSKKLLKWIVIGMSIFVYGSMIRANGIPSLRALNILSVYDIRGNVKYPFLMGYLVAWQAKIINPFLITISYINKNKRMLILSILMQLLIYLITAHKSFLLIPFAILVIIYILKSEKFLKLSAFLAPIGLIFSYLTEIIFGNLIIPSLFIRRFLFVPANLRFNYYEFFSNNKFLYFSEGQIGKVLGLQSPYSVKIANWIGYLYSGNIETSANTGYLADAYANMGVFGMFLISIILVGIFIFIDSMSTRIDKKIVIGLSLFSMMGLNDGSLLTALLTGGMLLLLILLYLYSGTVSMITTEERNGEND